MTYTAKIDMIDDATGEVIQSLSVTGIVAHHIDIDMPIRVAAEVFWDGRKDRFYARGAGMVQSRAGATP